MSALRKMAPTTWEEYNAQDEASPTKVEFINGEIIAMAGASPNHALITINTAGAVHSRLRGRPCYATSSDQRVCADASGNWVYPDLTIICPPAQFHERDGRTLLNPTIVFEVLSPSNADDDLIAKSDIYFQIPSIAAYVLISQDRVRVEVRTRGENGWNTRVYRQLSDEIELPVIGITLPISEIYERLELPAELHIVERRED